MTDNLPGIPPDATPDTSTFPADSNTQTSFIPTGTIVQLTSATNGLVSFTTSSIASTTTSQASSGESFFIGHGLVDYLLVLSCSASFLATVIYF
jgi:hypothetical protein